MPYINLGLSRHPMHMGLELKFLDFAYVVCLGLRYVKVQNDARLGTMRNPDSVLYFGGNNMDPTLDFGECETAYLHPLFESRLSDTRWVPTKSARRNLDERRVAAFFRGDMMPHSVNELTQSGHHRSA